MDLKNEYEYSEVSHETPDGYDVIGEGGMSELATEEALTHGVEQNYREAAGAGHSYNTPRTSTTDGVESVANQLGDMTLSPTEYYPYSYTLPVTAIETFGPGTASTATDLGYMFQSDYEHTGQIMQAMPTPALGTPTSPGGQPQYTHIGYGAEHGQNTDFVQTGGEESTSGYEYDADETRRLYGSNAASMQPSASQRNVQSAPKKRNAKQPISTASSSSTPRNAADTFSPFRRHASTDFKLGSISSEYTATVAQQGPIPSGNRPYYGYPLQGTIFHENYQVQQAPGQATQPTSESPYAGSFGYGHQGLQAFTDEADGENFDELAEIQYGSYGTGQADVNAYARFNSTEKGKSVEMQYTAGEVASVKKTKRSVDQRFSVFRSDEFWVGRVLKIYWAEPRGVDTSTASMFSTKRNDVFSKDRRFIILETWEGHSIGVPIMTYGGQGVKPRAHPECHGIVYTGDRPPQLLRNEAELGFPPVQMISGNGMEQLLPASRVNYRKRYTIEHNYSVNFVGHVRKSDFDRIFAQLQIKPARHNRYGGPTI